MCYAVYQYPPPGGIPTHGPADADVADEIRAVKAAGKQRFFMDMTRHLQDIVSRKIDYRQLNAIPGLPGHLPPIFFAQPDTEFYFYTVIEEPDGSIAVWVLLAGIVGVFAVGGAVWDGSSLTPVIAAAVLPRAIHRQQHLQPCA